LCVYGVELSKSNIKQVVNSARHHTRDEEVHSKQWVVLTQILVKYGQTQMLG